MRKNPRRILSPQRLPFRHPGIVQKTKRLVNHLARTIRPWCYWGAIRLEFEFHPPHSVEREVRCKMRIPHGHV